MNIGDLLTRDSVLLGCKAASYEEALEVAATHLGYFTELRPQQILQALLEREQKGSTGIGYGTAIPHARIEGLRAIHGAFLRLNEPVDAGAPDGTPVDIICVFLAPESANASYLRGVGKLASILRDALRRDLLRNGDKEQVYTMLTSEDVYA